MADMNPALLLAYLVVGLCIIGFGWTCISKATVAARANSCRSRDIALTALGGAFSIGVGVGFLFAPIFVLLWS